MDQLTIGEVARQAGIRASAIRYYESIGVLPQPRRINGRRRYSAAVLNTLAVVRIAQQAGFSVAEIKTLLNGFSADTPPSERWQAISGPKLSAVDALIAELQARKQLLEATLQCSCAHLDGCVHVLEIAQGTQAAGQQATLGT
ncbi:MAG: MerR family transcriptional regulator [Chloroflexota bacterium]|nr:MerR family transcriptional regulator [Chloroflexota bacterium]MDQ5864499.1 MerR family transcriptional regulator [Chloroflexota bacterium]